jgi:hypothetical protein
MRTARDSRTNSRKRTTLFFVLSFNTTLCQRTGARGSQWSSCCHQPSHRRQELIPDLIRNTISVVGCTRSKNQPVFINLDNCVSDSLAPLFASPLFTLLRLPPQLTRDGLSAI